MPLDDYPVIQGVGATVGTAAVVGAASAGGINTSILEKSAQVFESPSFGHLWDVILVGPGEKGPVSFLTDILNQYICYMHSE